MKPFLLTVLVLLSFGFESFAETLPKRKSGLWTIENKIEDKSSKVKLCVGANDNLGLNEFQKKMALQAGFKCNEKITKSGESYVVESDCENAKMKTRAKTVYTGDFKSTFVANLTGEDFPVVGAPLKRTAQTKGKYEGPCPANIKPGTVILPNGTTRDINNPHAMPQPSASAPNKTK